MKYIAIFIFAALLYSCASPGKLITSSGKPEVSFENKSRLQIADALRNWAPTKGQIVVSFDTNAIATNSSVEVSTGIGMKQSVGAKTIYNIVKNGTTTSVYALRFIAASREPFGYYKALPIASVLTNEYDSQDGLEELQKELENFSTFVKNN